MVKKKKKEEKNTPNSEVFATVACPLVVFKDVVSQTMSDSNKKKKMT